MTEYLSRVLFALLVHLLIELLCPELRDIFSGWVLTVDRVQYRFSINCGPSTEDNLDLVVVAGVLLIEPSTELLLKLVSKYLWDMLSGRTL